MRQIKRVLWATTTALALAGCTSAYGSADSVPAPAPAPAPAAAVPAVTQSMPADMASLDPSDSILFWSDERRSAAFRAMEDSFPGLEVAPAADPRVLPRASEMLPATVQREIRAYMDETNAAGVMVLKDGKVAAAFDAVPAAGVIVNAMVGRDIGDFYPDPPAAGPGPVRLAVRGGGNDRLDGIDLDLRAGEIVGLAGVQGAGRTALAHALFGLAPFERGTVTLGGEPVRLHSPRDAVTRGVVLLPGDRKAEGLALMQPVIDNAMLAARAFSPVTGHPDRTRYGTRRDMTDAFRAIDLRAASIDAPIASLSGGNQQKAIVARWLAMGPQVLLFVEPTRGIDVNTKAGIYRRMRALADDGAAVMVVSSDLPEVLGISDRVVVMANGRITAEFGRGEGLPAQFQAYRADGEEVARGEPEQGQEIAPAAAD